jgi:uncharacterized protein YfaQ (DUF2300 family)
LVTYRTLPLSAKRVPAGTHINQVKVKTAVAISKTNLRGDLTHRRISQAAVYLVEQGRGHLRYGGMYADGSTVWSDGQGTAEIVKQSIGLCWIEERVAA